MEIRIYTDANGHAPFEKWFVALKDSQAQARIKARIGRMQAGNFGDCKPVRGGVAELRIDHGPGYRLYLSRQGPILVLLLCGSDKADQSRTIKDALNCLADWKLRGEP